MTRDSVYYTLILSVIAFLFTVVSGDHGTGVWVSLLVFVAAFCLTGMGDVVWRSLLVRAAVNRWKRAGRVADDRTHHLLRLSRVNDGTLLLQFAVAALVTWRVH